MSEREPGESIDRLDIAAQSNEDNERTCVIIKPHAVRHREAILRIYRDQGLVPTRWRVLTPATEVVEEHYDEHRKASHFPTTVLSMKGRVIVYEFKGPGAIERIRTLNGKTNPTEAAEGTVRKVYGKKLPYNAVHASSDPEAAERELTLWFDRQKAVDMEPDAELDG